MNRRTVLLMSAAVLAAPVPALALDATAPLPPDRRLRVVKYDPDQVVQMFVRAGQSARVLLGPGECVVNMANSDQRTLGGEVELPQAQPPGDRERETSRPSSSNSCDRSTVAGGNGEPACDPNMCVSVSGNSVFIKPRRELEPQALFLRTEWCADDGKCEVGDYAFEISTMGASGPDGVRTVSTMSQPSPLGAFYSIRFEYPQRERAAAARAAAVRRAEAAERARVAAAQRAEAARIARENAPPLPSVPTAEDNWQYARCASNPDLWPDEVWDNGRTTFLRYNGTRRVPVVYEKDAGKEETLTPGQVVEPEPYGNTIRIGRTRLAFILRDGPRSSCVVNMGPDPYGHTAMAIASAAEAAPQHRTRGRRR